MISEYRLPRSTPEEQGVSSKAILKYLETIRENDSSWVWPAPAFSENPEDILIRDGSRFLPTTVNGGYPALAQYMPSSDKTCLVPWGIHFRFGLPEQLDR